MIKNYLIYLILKGKAFNTPLLLSLKRHNDLINNEEINFQIKSLKVNIVNKSIEEKNNLFQEKILFQF